MVTLYKSEILEWEEKTQKINQSLKPGFQYFSTLIMFRGKSMTYGKVPDIQKVQSISRFHTLYSLE